MREERREKVKEIKAEREWWDFKSFGSVIFGSKVTKTLAL